MASTLRTIRIEPGYGGQNIDDGHNRLGRDQSPRVTNLLADKGRLRLRGRVANPINVGSTIPGTQTLRGMSIYDRILTGRVFIGGAPWRANWKPYAAANLGKVYDASAPNLVRLDWIDMVTEAVTNSAVGTDRRFVPSWPSTRFGKWTYAISYDTIDDTVGPGTGLESIQPTSATGYERMTRIIRWAGGIPTVPVVYAMMPWGAQDLMMHYTRLFVLGGAQAGYSTGNQPDKQALWFSRVGTQAEALNGLNNADVNQDFWKDEVTMAFNRLDISGPDATDPGVAIGQVGRHMAVFKRHNLLLLTGYGPDSFQLRPITPVGCIDPRSVVETEYGIFWMSHSGFMHFDGAVVTNVTRGMHKRVTAAALQACGDDSTRDAGGVVATRVQRDHILITIGEPLTIGFGSFLYNIPSNTWSEVHFPSMPSSGIIPGISTILDDYGETENYQYARHRLASDTGNTHRISKITTLTVPEAEVSEPGGGSNPQGEDHEGTAEAKQIPFWWWSRVHELAMPTNKALTRRVMIDYEFRFYNKNQAQADAITGPTVEIRDGGNNLLDTYTLPTGPDLAVTQGLAGQVYPHSTYRQRHTRLVEVETTDIQVRISYEPVSVIGTIKQCSIQDVWVEYQPAQELP